MTQVGCCGFAVARAKYFASFDCVEVDSTFYNLPRLETAAHWRAAAPPRFAFCLKAWQVITHPATSPTYRRTRLDPRDREHCGHFGFNPTVRWAWDQTFAVAQTLRAVAVVFQCPPTFRPTAENIARLRQFFERAKRGRLLLGWEPRGEWPAELVGKLCHELDLVPVVDPLLAEPRDGGPLRYYRVHGTRPRLTAADWTRLQQACAGRTPTFCFFNTRWRAADARRFKDSISE
jgi:uncharacterized protein YecE (DUF72 family)